ncbi:nuclear transport factor 2 family protein [Mucilaginibacter sp.]|uniref:nuclear transport factor 2 family protein n=1 Tax=Mucilaginibacter sp. TaxID=1882438 RepID=UPI0025D98216|nr:nuclear transport factor 2 family protein [Mucilaginibacter sp.]
MPEFILFAKRILVIIVLFLPGIIQPCFAQLSANADSLTKVLIGKEAEMFNAILTADKPATDKMVGQDYITINADGVLEDKIEMMKNFGKFKGAAVTLSDKQVRHYGNLSIITGRAKFYLKSILVAEIFYTETWIYRNRKWDFIGWQGTMTGLPSYYPVIFTILGLILLYLIARFITKIIKRSRIKVV